MWRRSRRPRAISALGRLLNHAPVGEPGSSAGSTILEKRSMYRFATNRA